MLKTILVPLDGSQLSETSVPYAQELAGALGSEVVLASICEPTQSEQLHMHQLYIEKIAELMKRALTKGTKIKVNPVVLLGEPAEEIVNYAEKNNISLVIMASHGRSGIIPWTMGSTTNKVVHRINTPILLIRGVNHHLEAGIGDLFNRILVPLDGSDAGEAALPYVKELANKLKTDITLLKVVEPGQHVHTIGGLNYVHFTEQQVEAMKTNAAQYLKKASRKLRGTEGVTRSEVRIGDAAKEIIKYTNEANIELVAISSHGHSYIKQWIFGSVTQKILQAGNTPLLIVRAPG